MYVPNMRALVLGGGGEAGIAWEIGVLHALGPAVLDVDLVVGTSAGGRVAAALLNGETTRQAYERQLAPVPAAPSGGPGGPGDGQLAALFGSFMTMSLDEAAAKFGALARTSTTAMSEEEWVAKVAAELPARSWPTTRLAIAVIDVDSGERAVFDDNSGVALAASCSVPGVLPPVTLNGRRYMDGGMRRSNNADLAAGYDEVVLIDPFHRGAVPSNTRLITPSPEALAAFTANPLDPATRAPSARAGYAQMTLP
ncbi:patatin-like phospholipase family protein [Kibdelosporangium lantanae]